MLFELREELEQNSERKIFSLLLLLELSCGKLCTRKKKGQNFGFSK